MQCTFAPFLMRMLTLRSDSPTAADGQATFAPTLTERGRTEFPSNTWSSSPTTSLTINPPPPPPRPHPRVASSTSALSEADDGFEALGADLDIFDADDNSGEKEEEPHQTIMAAPLEPGGSGVAENPFGRGILVASSSQTTPESHQPLTRPISSMLAKEKKMRDYQLLDSLTRAHRPWNPPRQRFGTRSAANSIRAALPNGGAGDPAK